MSEKDFDVFISYFEENGRSFAELLKDIIMEEAKMNAFVAHIERPHYSADFESVRENVIKTSRFFVFINTIRSLRREQIIREFKLAYPEGFKNSPKLIIFYHKTLGNTRSSPEFLQKAGLNYDIAKYNQQDFLDYEDLSTKARNFFDVILRNIPFEDQTNAAKMQTIHSDEFGSSDRPWLYPSDTTHHLKLLINRIAEPSYKGLKIRVIKNFINEGRFPIKSVTCFLTYGKKRIEDFKSNSNRFDQSAVFPNRSFQVDVPCFFDALCILENKRFKRLSYNIYIGILLEYRYGVEQVLRSGFYKGMFGIDRLVYEDTLDYEIYWPLLFIVDQDFG